MLPREHRPGPTPEDVTALRDEVKGILTKATESDDSAAEALRGLAGLSEYGFSDAPVIQNRDEAGTAVGNWRIRQQGIELEKEYKGKTRWPYEWGPDGTHPRGGKSDSTGEVGFAEEELIKEHPMRGRRRI